MEGKPTSMQILLDWLTTDNNYGRWHGGDITGKSKEALLGEILEIMHQNRIWHRKKNDIRCKINDLTMSYNKARDWKAKTGEEVIANDPHNSEATIRGKCVLC